jgi:serine phosphatase RsbU (regulator of sigma subunit)
MVKLGFHYIWFKLALAMGSVLGLVLLVQSVRTYYRVSDRDVNAYLSQEARRQLDALPREAFDAELDQAKLKSMLEDLRQEAPSKIAWVRLLDSEGKATIEVGKPVGPPLKLIQAPAGKASPQGSATAVPAPKSGPVPFGRGGFGPLPEAQSRKTPEGWVRVEVMRFFPRGRAGGRGGPGGGDAAPPGTPAAGTSPALVSGTVGSAAPRVEPRRDPARPVDLAARMRRPAGQPGTVPAAQPGRGELPRFDPRFPGGPGQFRQRFLEMALHFSSASEVYGALLQDLVINSSAALGLVASMVLLYFRLPHYVNGKRLEQQTELARQVQMDLLPPAKFSVQNLSFAAECVPAWQVGGDFYDVFSGDHGKVAVVLGDVSGKGLPASVVVGLLLGAVRASDWMSGTAEHEASSGRLSELIRTRTALERFASLFWCYFEPETQTLRYINAGHPPPMLVKRNVAGESEILLLEEGGPVLGVVPGATYHQGHVSAHPGDLLVVYSDGVVEATNIEGEQFEEERLHEVIRQNSTRQPVEIRDLVLEQVHRFLGEQRAQDDLTLVVGRIVEGDRGTESEPARESRSQA